VRLGARVAKQIKDEGAAFGGAKGKPEDAEMRSATRVIQACGVATLTLLVHFAYLWPDRAETATKETGEWQSSQRVPPM
jgi:hypothetical protein